MRWLYSSSFKSECDFKIPSKEAFDESTVRAVLSEFLLSDISTRPPIKFNEILLFREYRSDSPMYQDFLKPFSHLIFRFFTADLLQSVPMDVWPNKGYFITELLETSTAERKTIIAETLELSPDPQTAKVGHHILSALQSPSLTLAIPHFYALTELLPNFNRFHVEIIFGRTFKTFQEDRTLYTEDPSFTRELLFNGIREVFISGNLMIGVHASYRGTPHLLAYDMTTEKMQWGIPLPSMLLENPDRTLISFGFPQKPPGSYCLNRVGEHLTFQGIGEKNVHFIDPHSGETIATIALPYEKRDESDSLHLTPNGFGYQMVNSKDGRKLIGGKIFDSKLNLLFEVETPGSYFLPLSTHVGFFSVPIGLSFLSEGKPKLVLFGPTGESVTIDCLSAYALGDKLYLVEPNPSKKDTCKLTIRTLSMEDHVVSPPEKSIILEVKKASIESLCDNGELLLFSNSRFNKSPIFVNLDCEDIVYGKHMMKSDAAHVINTATGELWSWDPFSQEIWKTSSKKTTFMGCLESGRGTTFSHVDRNHLYFVDLPW